MMLSFGANITASVFTGQAVLVAVVSVVVVVVVVVGAMYRRLAPEEMA